ncbi:MAG: multiheme c-type cytochrome, partial [Planctomycetota bacterium]
MKSLKNSYSFFILTSFLVLAFPNFVVSQEEEPVETAPIRLREYVIERKLSKEAKECIDCHAKVSEGIVADWANSRHAHVVVSCLDCHGTNPADKDISNSHLEYDNTPISGISSPKDCSRCHPTEAAEYARSKHANTVELMWKIDPWLNQGLNSDLERTTGCFHCHG